MAKTAGVPVVAGKRVYKNNNREIDVSRTQFKKLAQAVSESILKMASFDPSKHSPKELRQVYDEIYRFCQEKATVAYDREFVQELMYGVCVKHIDLVNGVIEIFFRQTMARVDAGYCLTVRNEQAPYSQTWPELLAQHGGDAQKTKVDYELV